VSPQFHVVFDEKFTTIHNDARLNDTTIESIFNDLFETCRDYFGEETIAPEGADVNSPDTEIIIDETPELGDEWLSKPEVCEKKARADTRRAKQHEIRQSQAKDFEKLNADYNPPYPGPADITPDGNDMPNLPPYVSD